MLKLDGFLRQLTLLGKDVAWLRKQLRLAAEREMDLIMTVQDVKDALTDQHQVILAKFDEVTAAIKGLQIDPAALDDLHNLIVANTDEIKAFVVPVVPVP